VIVGLAGVVRGCDRILCVAPWSCAWVSWCGGATWSSASLRGRVPGAHDHCATMPRRASGASSLVTVW